MADNLQIKTAKLIKYANEKFGTNETDLRSIIDNADISGGEYNIDQIIDGDECELVITLADGKEVIYVDLPEIFSSATQVYSFQVNEDILLLSCDVANCGVWRYKISTNSMEQKFSSGGDVKYFHMSGSDCLLSNGTFVSGFKVGVLLYETTSDSISQLYDGAYWTVYHLINDNNYLITTSTSVGILLYDANTKTITKLTDSGYHYDSSKFVKIDDYNYLIASFAYIFKYSASDKVLTMLYKNPDSASYVDSVRATDKYCLYGCSNAGTYLYEFSSGTFQHIYEVGYWHHQWIINNDCLLINSSQGIFLFDWDTKQISLKFSGGTYYSEYNKYIKFEEDLFIYKSSYNTNPLMYISKTKSIEVQDAISGRDWNILTINNKIIICSTSSNYKGLWLYDNINKIITNIYSDGYNWTVVASFNNGVLMDTPSSSHGLILLDTDAIIVTKLLSSGYNYKAIKKINNTCLIASRITNGIKLYDNDTKTIKSLTNIGSSWDTVKQEGDYYYISNTSKIILKYDPSNQTAIISRYKLK